MVDKVGRKMECSKNIMIRLIESAEVHANLYTENPPDGRESFILMTSYLDVLRWMFEYEEMRNLFTEQEALNIEERVCALGILINNNF